jgi:sensor c-di-GMP phosphodiesterase-like protein
MHTNSTRAEIGALILANVILLGAAFLVSNWAQWLPVAIVTGVLISATHLIARRRRHDGATRLRS